MAHVLLGQLLPLEHVPEMGPAGGTENLRPSPVGVRQALHGAGQFVVEARPATTGVELVIGFIKRRAASSAHVGPGLVVIVILAGEGPLRALLYNDGLFLGCQLFQDQASLLFDTSAFRGRFLRGLHTARHQQDRRYSHDAALERMTAPTGTPRDHHTHPFRAPIPLGLIALLTIQTNAPRTRPQLKCEHTDGMVRDTANPHHGDPRRQCSDVCQRAAESGGRRF